jgi:2-keto-4-pentenoate hydratase/2-oxohepta-3-ene-1,7-dioic acid hydratase in catechol pathway
MKLVTYTRERRSSVGALLGDDAIVDLPSTDRSIPADMLELLRGGPAMMERARAAAAKAQECIALAGVTLEAPIARPGKVLAIGLNYRDHAEESGQAIPARPVVFAKVSTCITGPGKPVHRPKLSGGLDWEGELCFVIGAAGRHISAADAPAYVAGYMIGNDISVRDWQFHSPTWMMGKGFDTHGPIGPWLVTSDEVDPSALAIATYVNGDRVQASNTSQLIFDVGAIIEYLSAAFTLEPGDVVFTGTPAGIGASRKPPLFLKVGDVVRVEIDGLGVLENPVIDEP